MWASTPRSSCWRTTTLVCSPVMSTSMPSMRRDDGCAPADAHAPHVERVAAFFQDFNVNGVGMLDVVCTLRSAANAAIVRGPHEPHAQARFLRALERVAYAQVIGGKPQHAGHQGLVGAVPCARVRERPVQRERHVLGARAAQPPRHARDGERPRRMRAGRPHHDRPDDVAQSQCLHGRPFRRRAAVRLPAARHSSMR